MCLCIFFVIERSISSSGDDGFSEKQSMMLILVKATMTSLPAVLTSLKTVLASLKATVTTLKVIRCLRRQREQCGAARFRGSDI